MKKLQIDIKSTKQVRVDAGWHKILSLLRVELETPMRSLIEEALSNTYTVDKNGKPKKIKL